MLLVLAASAAMAITPAAPPRNGAAATARASIRIVEPVRLRIGATRSLEGQAVRDALIRTADGRQERAKLVELE